MLLNHTNPHEARPKLKLTLRVLATLLTIISIILSGVGHIWAWQLWTPLGDVWPWELWLALSVSLIWNTVNITRRLSAATPIHPGANVGVDLFIWLLFFFGLWFTFENAAFGIKISTAPGVEPEPPTTSGNATNTASNNTSIYPHPLIEVYMALASAAVGTVDFGLHVALFVFACIDTHRVRKPDRYPVYRRGKGYAELSEDKIHMNGVGAVELASTTASGPGYAELSGDKLHVNGDGAVELASTAASGPRSEQPGLEIATISRKDGGAN